MLLVAALGVLDRQVPIETLRFITNHKRIAALFRQSHTEFGCIPDPQACPTWDCATSYTTAGGCNAVFNSSEAFIHLNWRLCYDRGLSAYMFTSEAWCDNDDCCSCSVTRLRKPGVHYVCSHCDPCCLHCDHDDSTYP